MIKKRWIKTMFVLLAALLAAGCQNTDKKEEAKDQADGNKEVYQFVDVLGQQYEACLLYTSYQFAGHYSAAAFRVLYCGGPRLRCR